MTTVHNRSMVRSMLEGSTDGTYKKLSPDTTNPDPGNRWNRKHNMAWPYGIDESTSMETPDGRTFHPDPVDWLKPMPPMGEGK